MRPETFLEKFDLIADAPGAVAKMRELVLELAVRGKLTSQQDTGKHDANTTAPFLIPSDWNWSTLDALGDTKPRNTAQDQALCSFVPMPLISAEYGKLATHETRKWVEVKKGYTHFQEGDVVMAKITPCFENAKSSVMRNLTGGFGAGTTELHVFRAADEAIIPEFVIIYVKSRGFIERGIPRMTGSAGQKRVPWDYFAKSPFPLPPLAEQKRIVAKVDELMTLCERLEQQQNERETQHTALSRASLTRFSEAPTPENLHYLFHPSYTTTPADLRKTILTLAVQGKLVPQDPNDVDARTMIDCALEKRKQTIKTKKLRRKELDESADLFRHVDLPYSWCVERFANLVDPENTISYGVLVPGMMCPTASRLFARKTSAFPIIHFDPTRPSRLRSKSHTQEHGS